MTLNHELPRRPNTIAVTYINASVARVWASFTDPKDQSSYFGGKTEIGEVGEPWIRHATDKWPAITGIVLAKEPQRRLLITWGFDNNPPPDRIEFLVDPAANGTTRVTIKEYHSREWPQDTTDSAVQGWAALLAGLKTMIETGKPLPAPF